MAVNFVQQVQSSQAAGVTTWDAPALSPAAGSLLVCMVAYYKTASVAVTLSDTTGSNGSWTAADTDWQTGVGEGFGIASFYLANAAATSSTIRATYASAIDNNPAIYVAEFSGTDNGAALAHVVQYQDSPGSGADAISSGLSGVLTSQPALIFGFSWEHASASGTFIAGTGYTGLTMVWVYGGASPFARPEWQRVTSTASIAATFRDQDFGGGNKYHTFLMAFAESTGSAPTANLSLATLGPGTYQQICVGFAS